MPHDISLISTIAIGFALAFAFGFLAAKLNLPPLIGYLLAGIAIGPYTPGFIADGELASQLAEIGVMLLMFGVGLHFSIADLIAVRRIAVPGAVGQIVIATLVGALITLLWGWKFGSGIVLGLSLSVASTVVMLKALEERNAVSTSNGRIAIGWLVVEDLAMVLTLVLLPALAGVLGGHAASDNGHSSDGNLLVTLLITLLKVGAFVAIALIVGTRLMPWLLRQAARTGSRELFTLCVLAVALGIAFGAAKLFGVSFALGAFFAGMILHESDLSHKAATNSLPFQDAFSVLFFVSVGMLFDPSILLREPLMVASVAGLILVGKSLIALAIVMIMGYPLSTGLVVSASLAQIGEFSFILGGLGIDHGLLTREGLNLILAGALISITINPLVFAATDRICAWVRKSSVWNRRLEENRKGPLNRLEDELEKARLAAEKKAAEHKTFTPEELVARFPLFAGLTQEQRELLLLHLEIRRADPGERIIRKGDAADVVYFISEGEVEVSVAGQRIRLGPGECFGEMALINDNPRSADVTALDYCRFATLSRRDFRRFLNRYPELRSQITAIAEKREAMNLSSQKQSVPGE